MRNHGWVLRLERARKVVWVGRMMGEVKLKTVPFALESQACNEKRTFRLSLAFERGKEQERERKRKGRRARP